MTAEPSAPQAEPSAPRIEEVGRLRESVRRISQMLDVSCALLSEFDRERLFATIMDRATEILDADRSTLFLVDTANDQLWSSLAQGDGITEIRFPRSAGIAGHVATTGETINIVDAYADPRFNPEIDTRTGYRTKTILCMPVRDPSGSIIGVLQVLNKRRGSFTSEDEDLLGTLGTHAAVALASAGLMEARRKEIEKSQTLLKVMRSLSSELEIDQLLGRIMEEATEVMQADRSSLFLVDHNTNELWFKVAQGAALQEVRIPMGVGIAGHVAATGATVNTEDAYKDPRFNQEVDRRTGYRTRTMLCMPMRDPDGTIVGVLQVLNKKSGLFTSDDEALLDAFGSQAVIAIKNAQLYEDVVRMKNYNESVLFSMANGVVTLDMGARTSTANPAAARILGLEGGVPLGEEFDDVVDKAVNHEIWELASRALDRAESVRVEKVRYTTSLGNPVVMNISVVPLRDHKAVQIGIVMVIEDISREQQLVGTLSRVVSRQVAEQLLASGKMPSVGGERKNVTVLMSDIRDFTTMAESSNPEEIVAMLNDYFGRMIQVIFRHEGTLDKFIGDAIMAVFGTPVAHTDDPARAVLTGIEMRRALYRFNEERRAQGRMTIEIGVGICDGEAVAGAIGSEERLEFTVIGDTVNTSARLEGLTKVFPDHKIVFNEPVYEAVKSFLPCDFLVEEYVKGKLQPVKVYGVPESFVASTQFAGIPGS